MEKGLVSGLNDEDADVRLELGLARAEVAQRAAATAIAARFAAIDATLREAREHPELYLSPSFRGNDAAEFAERSAAADLAVRLRMSESTIRSEALRAGVLRGSLPTIWAAFRAGDIAPANAQTAADFALTLPEAYRLHRLRRRSARPRTDPRTCAVTATVAVTVPVLTLLGAAELPGTLEGFGPIDADTARRLAAHAPSFQRILTHPITGTILDIDRRSYRPTADLKRWLGLRDAHCTFAGCGRRAAECDLDHRVAWAEGGRTSVDNLAHLCRHHHRLKHEAGWRSERAAAGGSRWTSPTGAVHDPDPPPF